MLAGSVLTERLLLLTAPKLLSDDLLTSSVPVRLLTKPNPPKVRGDAVLTLGIRLPLNATLLLLIMGALLTGEVMGENLVLFAIG